MALTSDTAHARNRFIAVPPHPVAQALQTANAHDVEGFVGCFSAQGAIDAWGMLFQGASGVTGWMEHWVVAHCVQFNDVLAVPDGDGVAVRTQVRSSGFNGAVTLTFSLRGGAIDLLRLSAS